MDDREILFPQNAGYSAASAMKKMVESVMRISSSAVDPRSVS